LALLGAECQASLTRIPWVAQLFRPAFVTNLGVEREFSAGAVVVRRLRGRWWLAAIRPGGKREGKWAIPKGNVGDGESPEETALREVTEETGLEGVSEGKLGDVRYVYTRSGNRIFKVVSFYLVRYRKGRIDHVPASLRHEVAEARWLPLEEAPRLLAYAGEREMASNALATLEANPV
jgi:8-oxo-dGTP pyrophosphatase MutT (NUDIX family)